MNTSRATWTLILSLVLALLPAGVLAQDEAATDENRPGAKRPGFYLAADIGGAYYHIDDSIDQNFEANGVDLSNQANGFGLSLGYSWRNEFALELEAYGAAVSTGTTEVDAGLGQFDLIFVVPLLPRSRLAPYLEGHVGATALGFGGDGVDDRVVVGGSTGAGAGLEVHLSRRWALDFGYRFSLVSFGEESIEFEGGGSDEVEIDGTGQVHRWMVRTVFSF